jgi:hypothetical protein
MANTLAYYDMTIIPAVISFMVQAPKSTHYKLDHFGLLRNIAYK